MPTGNNTACQRIVSVQNIKAPGDCAEDLGGAIEHLARMRRGHNGSNASFAARHRREPNSGGIQPGVEQLPREAVRGGRFANHNGRNRRFALPRIESCVPESALKIPRVLPQAFNSLRLLFEDVEGGKAGGGDAGRVRRREQERSRAMVQKLNQVAAAAHVSAEYADSL